MQVKVTLSDPVWAALAARAGLERRSMSAMGALLLEEALSMNGSAEAERGAVDAFPLPASAGLGSPRSASAGSDPAEMRVSPPVEGAARGGPRGGVGKTPRDLCLMSPPAGTKCKSCGKVHG